MAPLHLHLMVISVELGQFAKLDGSHRGRACFKGCMRVVFFKCTTVGFITVNLLRKEGPRHDCSFDVHINRLDEVKSVAFAMCIKLKIASIGGGKSVGLINIPVGENLPDRQKDVNLLRVIVFHV